jgi:hypothetical protein
VAGNFEILTGIRVQSKVGGREGFLAKLNDHQLLKKELLCTDLMKII